ncbi:MAG: hypothetical protein L7F78_21540 [Syntrophales bacterium LBB04]|nr:hypothetical protein [Syntrophales bacterium LBB04]
MKRTMTTLGALMTMATPAMAAGGTETEGTSLFIILLLAFGALIVACQLIPGFFMLSAMIKGIFGKDAAKTKSVEDHK